MPLIYKNYICHIIIIIHNIRIFIVFIGVIHRINIIESKSIIIFIGFIKVNYIFIILKYIIILLIKIIIKIEIFIIKGIILKVITIIIYIINIVIIII